MKKQGRHSRNECYSGGSENRSFREDGRLLQVFTEMGSEKLGQIRQILDRNRTFRRNGSQPIFQKHKETGTECGEIIGGSTAQKSAGIKLLPLVPFNSPAASSNSTSSQLDSSDKMSSSSCSNESSASNNAREYLSYGVSHGKLVDSKSCSNRQAHTGSFSNWSSYSQVLESSTLTQKFDQEDDSLKQPFAVRRTVLNSRKQDSNQRYDSCDTLQEKLLDGSKRQHQRSYSFSSYSQSQLNLSQEFDAEDDSLKQPFISAKHQDERNQNSCHRDDLSYCSPSTSTFKSGGFSVYPGWFPSMSPCDSVAVAYQYQPLDTGFKTRHLPRRRQNSISNHRRLPSNHRVDIEMPDSTSQPEFRKNKSSYKKHQRTKSASSFGPSHHSEIKNGRCTNSVLHLKKATKIQVVQTGQLFGRQKSSIKEMSKSLSRLGSMHLSDHSKEEISRKVSFRPKQKGYSRSESLTPSRLGSPPDHSRQLTKMSFNLKSSLADYVPASSVKACLEFDPILGYRFWLDEQDEMLIARDCTEISEATAKTTLLFYSWKPGAWSNWKKEKGKVKVVAKMEIRNQIRPEIVADGEISHYIDLEFKLLDSRPGENVQQKVPLSSTEKVLNRISKLYHRSSSCPSSPTLKKKFDGMETSETKATCNDSLYCSPLKLRRERKSIDFDEFWNNPTVKSSRQIMSFESNVELAAMLISMPIHSRMQDWENMARTLGWGMSFLMSKNNADGSSESESETEELEKRSIKVNTTRQRRDKSDKSSGKQHTGNQEVQMNFILAAGRHGCPSHGLAGPEPLLTRWKSGGKCDCGSWDLGCGLHILGGEIQSTNSSCSELLKIYTEDKERQENIMKLSSTENGQFSIDFQSPMSSIQAFAIAISTIRTIFRATSPTLKRMEEPRRRVVQSSNHRLFENSNSVSVAEDHFKDVSGSLKKLRRAYTLGCHAPSQIERV